jgi:hypothetical protein
MGTAAQAFFRPDRAFPTRARAEVALDLMDGLKVWGDPEYIMIKV